MKNWLLLLPLLLLISCSVQKRKYQTGFYFAGRQEEKHPSAKKTVSDRDDSRKHEDIRSVAVGTPPDLTASASAGKKTNAIIVAPRKPLAKLPADTCDRIVFRDGNEIRARILEIGPSEIKYKKCDIPDGPFFVSRKADIFMINFANGTKEVFATASPETAATKPPPRLPTEGRYRKPENVRTDAIISLVLGIVGLIFFYYGSIHAIILGRRVLKATEQYPALKGSENMAKAGVVLGIIKLALFAALMAFTVIMVI